jgi:hypothetical protein
MWGGQGPSRNVEPRGEKMSWSRHLYVGLLCTPLIVHGTVKLRKSSQFLQVFQVKLFFHLSFRAQWLLYVTSNLTFNYSAFCPEYIYGFRMVLTISSDYFLKQHWPVDICNGDVLCFLCGRNWIFKYYLDKLWLQMDSYHLLVCQTYVPPVYNYSPIIKLLWHI